MENYLIGAAGGLVGGALGTAFMQGGMALADKLPDALKPPMPTEDPGEFMVRTTEDATGYELPLGVHRATAYGLHWAYGTFWGTLLGLASPALGVESLPEALAAGASMGALCWAAGYVGWLPATGLTPPVQRQGASHVASSLATHAVYGMLAALPVWALGRLLTPRRRAWYAFWR